MKLVEVLLGVSSVFDDFVCYILYDDIVNIVLLFMSQFCFVFFFLLSIERDCGKWDQGLAYHSYLFDSASSSQFYELPAPLYFVDDKIILSCLPT